jgi:hypothetical protein
VSVSDNRGGSVTQTVTVTITGSGDAPVALTDTNSGNPGAIVNILFPASPICPLQVCDRAVSRFSVPTQVC